MAVVIARSEFRKIIAIVVVCFVAAHLRKRQASRRWLKWSEKASKEDEHKKNRIVDHPFFPYLLENAYLFLMPLLIRRIGSIDSKRPLVTFLTVIAQDTAIVLSAVYFQKFVADVLYKHVPYFTTTRPSDRPKDLTWDYLRCNLPNDVAVGALQTLIFTMLGETPEKLNERDKSPIAVFPFLAKLLFGRILVDINFYLVHRWLHTDFGYKMIHYRHHEHTAPRLQTNFHFLSIDLFLEAAFPVIANLLIFKSLGIRLTPVEELVMGHFYLYFEIASHTGKELPVVTWFPPLAPVVDAITNFDQRLVEYHTRHHQLFNCNYSISPWPDMLMGSYQMEYKVKDDN